MKIFGYIILMFVLILGGYFPPGYAQDHSTTLVFPTKSHAPVRKATRTHLFFAVGTATTVSDPQGTALAKLTVQDDPETESDDDELTVYGVNAGNNEVIYNTSLINIEIYREPPGTPGALNNPRGIAADVQGNVYVADMGNQRIVHLKNEDGKQLVYYTNYRPESAPNFSPFDVALAQDGTLFVSDSAGSKIWKCSPNTPHWEVVRDSIATPLGITTHDGRDRWTRYRTNQLGIVADGGKKVLITDYQGRKIATYKAEEKIVRFRYIAVDYYNNYYVTDTANGQILKINRRGQLTDIIGEQGRGDYQFDQPQGIAIWKRFGQVCIAESYAAQYYLIGTDVLRTSLNERNNFLGITFNLTERADVTLTVRKDGSPADTFFADKRIAQGDFTYRWHLPEDLEPGEYTFTISAVPTYSSTKYFTARREVRWQYNPSLTEPAEYEEAHE